MFCTLHLAGGRWAPPGESENKKDVVEYVGILGNSSHKTGQDCHSGLLLQSEPYPAARSSFRLGCHLAHHPETARSIRLMGCLSGPVWVGRRILGQS